MTSIATSSIRILHNACCARPVQRVREVTPADLVLIAADHGAFVVNAEVFFDACPPLRDLEPAKITFHHAETESSHTLYAFLAFLRYGSLDGLWDLHDIRDHWRHLSNLVSFMRRYEAVKHLDLLVAYFTERLEGVHVLPPNYVVLAFLLGARLGSVPLCQAAIHRTWLPPAGGIGGLGLSLDVDEDAAHSLVPGCMPRSTEELIPVLYRWALRRSWDKAAGNQYWWGAYFAGMVIKATKRV